MPQARQPLAAEIARKQLNLLLRLAEQAGIDGITLSDELHLSPADWQQWLGVLHDGPLPARPALPQMLRHLGYLTSRLDREARLTGAWTMPAGWPGKDIGINSAASGTG
jgi:hypothetical protein